jgi:hypothetical protein
MLGVLLAINIAVVAALLMMRTGASPESVQTGSLPPAEPVAVVTAPRGADSSGEARARPAMKPPSRTAWLRRAASSPCRRRTRGIAARRPQRARARLPGGAPRRSAWRRSQASRNSGSRVR